MSADFLRIGGGLVWATGRVCLHGAAMTFPRPYAHSAQVVVRNDDQVTNARSGAIVYVGNLAPSVTWQVLRDHMKTVDASGSAHTRVIADTHGGSMGYGFIEFRSSSQVRGARARALAA